MDDLTPVTRTERLLDGEDLTPTNREEMFIKRIYDKTQEIPEPVNRKEYFLKKAGEAGGDVTVVPLSVTDNGIYSEEGKAYSPVTVSVQPPANSYQLKSITTPTSLATFEASEMPMPTLKVSVEAKQDLHGYDKPWVGGAGKNKFDDTLIVNPTSTAQWIQVTLKPNMTYTVSSNIPYFSTSAYIFAVSGTNTSGATSATDGVGLNTSRTVTADSNGIISFAYRNNGGGGTLDLTQYHYQIEEGSTATTWQPYSNICPIIGWDAANVLDRGANFWDEQWVIGDINSATGEMLQGNYVCSKNLIPVIPNTSFFFFSGEDAITKAKFYIYQYDKNKNYLGIDYYTNIEANTAIITAPDAYFIKFLRGGLYGNTYQNNMSIILNTEEHKYYPYNGVTTTITLGQTVYGGEVDVVNGTSGNRLTHGEVDLGTLNWSLYPNYTNLFRAPILSNMATVANEASANWLCSIYEVKPGAAVVTTDKTIGMIHQSYIIITDTSYTSASDFKTAMNGVQLVYELATPTTFTTSPTPIKSLEGTNNLSVDCGEVIEGEYFKALGGE